MLGVALQQLSETQRVKEHLYEAQLWHNDPLNPSTVKAFSIGQSSKILPVSGYGSQRSCPHREGEHLHAPSPGYLWTPNGHTKQGRLSAWASMLSVWEGLDLLVLSQPKRPCQALLDRFHLSQFLLAEPFVFVKGIAFPKALVVVLLYHCPHKLKLNCHHLQAWNPR